VILKASIILSVNSTHRKTLAAIFSQPTPAAIEWRRIEALLMALGATLIEGDGSRVSFILNNEKADFHRPHPGKDAKRYQVRNARDFLNRAGVTP
jgi:hypothetical protein